LKLDFTKGKQYNVKQVNDWLNKIPNPSLSNAEQKNSTMICYHLLNFIMEDVFRISQ
jgi:hypothetical protein